MDWEKFKEKEGIREELQSHNKGKDGYVISGNHQSNFLGFLVFFFKSGMLRHRYVKMTMLVDRHIKQGTVAEVHSCCGVICPPSEPVPVSDPGFLSRRCSWGWGM